MDAPAPAPTAHCRRPSAVRARAASGWRALALVVALGVVASGCAATSTEQDPVVLRLWTHGGTGPEREALQELTSRFHSRHSDITVDLRVVAEGDYTTALQAATAAGDLPDVLDVDGPLVAAFASQGALAPLDGLLDAATVANMTEPMRLQGTWRERLWALGTFDSGLGLWADRAALARAGLRVPGIDDPWTGAEMTAALTALAAVDDDGRVLDLKRDYGVGEWLTYGFAPLLASAGGELDMSTLDTPANVRALDRLASWRAFVDPSEDGRAFTRRRVALSWVGHWTYPEYRAALGDDLVLLPLPDLGTGSRTGSGSWAWAVSRGSDHPEQAARLLEFLAEDDSVRAVVQANGALPGTRSVLDLDRPDPRDPRILYYRQRDRGQAVPRPTTPDYPSLTAAFATAVQQVLDGTPPALALRASAASLG